MTPRERKDLRELVKNRARLETMRIDERAKAVEADVEQQLAATYDIAHAAWAEVTKAADKAVQEADQQVAERCARLGIPANLRPKLNMWWSNRGENSVTQRRTELRRVAVTRIQALARAAKTQIVVRALELDTQLVAGALTSADARAFLAQLPQVEALMPALDIKQLEAHTPAGGGR